MRIALVFFVIYFAAASTAAAPPRLVAAEFRGGCESYSITVSGEGLDQPDSIVSYSISLAPRSGGEPMIITDSFPVTAEKNGTFHRKIRQSWKQFGFAPSGDYTLSGSAILISKLTPLHVRAIVFARAKLSCG